MIEFIRSQVEPEVVEDMEGPWDLYGPLVRWYAYKPGWPGCPLPTSDDADAYRVALIGA